jgi:hypothetical protein
MQAASDAVKKRLDGRASCDVAALFQGRRRGRQGAAGLSNLMPKRCFSSK